MNRPRISRAFEAAVVLRPPEPDDRHIAANRRTTCSVLGASVVGLGLLACGGCASTRVFDVNVSDAEQFEWNKHVRIHERTVRYPFGDSTVQIVGLELPGSTSRDVRIEWMGSADPPLRATVQPRNGLPEQFLGYRVYSRPQWMAPQAAADPAQFWALVDRVRAGQYEQVDGFALASGATRHATASEALYELDESLRLRLRTDEHGDVTVQVEGPEGQVRYEYRVQALPIQPVPAGPAGAATSPSR